VSEGRWSQSRRAKAQQRKQLQKQHQMEIENGNKKNFHQKKPRGREDVYSEDFGGWGSDELK